MQGVGFRKLGNTSPADKIARNSGRAEKLGFLKFQEDKLRTQRRGVNSAPKRLRKDRTSGGQIAVLGRVALMKRFE